MNWKEIHISSDKTTFFHNDIPMFGKTFTEVLKFHEPGIAPVKDASGAYHIDWMGNELYAERYERTFGFYCNRAGVVQGGSWFHLTEKGVSAYPENYAWVGNYQENSCTVRNQNKRYFHIDLTGKRLYDQDYLYCGDYKDGVSCVKKLSGKWIHIDVEGSCINDKEFLALGVFHKGFATAKDSNGWFHIDFNGNEIYTDRYLNIEPFYNGFALVEGFDQSKRIIDESGVCILTI